MYKIAFLFLILSWMGCGARKFDQTPATNIAATKFRMRCASAGEFIYHTVDNVDGLFLMKIRPRGINFGDQFKMDDPYGSDLYEEGYIETFLRQSYDLRLIHEFARSNAASVKRPTGYEFVEAVAPDDGFRYRYTERVEEPWKTNKSYLAGYFKTTLEKKRVTSAKPRYGVTFEDISSFEDRSLWIAGSSLKIIDLQENKLMGERIGYMFDPAQGSTAGGRSPWLIATRYACPSFGTQKASINQIHQTIKFVEKILHPTGAEK